MTGKSVLSPLPGTPARRRIAGAIGVLAIAIVALFAATEGAAAQQYKRLYTQWKGTGTVLDVINGGPNDNFLRLAPAGNYSGQNWVVVNKRSPHPWNRLSSEFRSNLCLDVVNGGPRNNFVHLQPCADSTGQDWKLRKDGAWYRLSSRFRGDGRCLDVVNGGPNDGMVWLAPCGAYSGQFWQFN